MRGPESTALERLPSRHPRWHRTLGRRDTLMGRRTRITNAT